MSRLLGIFGREQENVWRMLSEEVGGEFIEGRGLLGKDLVRIQHQHWTLLLDTFKRPKQPTYTRIRAAYVNRDSFEFRIFRKDLSSGISKAAGMQDIEVGHEEFDRDFIIQGNDEIKLRQLFDHNRIRQIISWQPRIQLFNEVDETWVTHPFGEGLSELSFEAMGVIKDLQQLRDLYELFSQLLNHLCHIGSAYEQDPELSC